MSRLRFTKVSTPSSPAANKMELFYSSTLSPVAPALVDESGNVCRVGGFTTKDYRLVKVTTILNGTVSYTPASGVSALWAECVGGGGGSGGAATTAASNSSAGGGGGGGAYSATWSTALVSGSHTVAVGAGGTAGTAGANPGGTGGTTTFKDTAATTICEAVGGGLGAGGATTPSVIFGAAGGAGGAAASGTGDLKVTGEGASPGLPLQGGSSCGGQGGSSVLGGGARANLTTINSGNAGIAGGVYGGGASGAASAQNAVNQAGGLGGNGLIRVWEYA
jgi:hypothetical protein